MIANRVTITVPAAGAWSRHTLAGSLVYVEASPVDTPAGVPVIAFISGNDGIPCYTHLKFVVCGGFNEFWIKGTTDSAGGTLNLLVLDDPCASLGGFAPNPCGGATATPFDPDGVPTAFLTYNANELATVGLDFAETQLLAIGCPATTELSQLFWIDYIRERIYFLDDSTTNLRLMYTTFAGAAAVLVYNFATASDTTNVRGLTWSPTLGAFIVGMTANDDGIRRVNKDGTGDVLIDNTPGSYWVADPENGTHFYSQQSTGGTLALKLLTDGTSVNTITASKAAPVCDPITGYVYWRGESASDYPLRRAAIGGNFSDVEDLFDMFVAGGLFIRNRWLYFIADLNDTDELHCYRLPLDTIDTATPEQLTTTPTTSVLSSHIYAPLWI